MTLSEPALTPALFDVYVSDECSAVLNGEPVAAAAGQSIHEVILDLLQRHARARQEPVKATVFDRSDARTFRIEVAPDGSSRIPEPAADETAAVGADNPTGRHHDVVASGAARETTEETPVPTSLADRVHRIKEAVSHGDTEHASVLAAALHKRLTSDLGADHPHSLEARAMESYVAHVGGDHRLATVLSLGVARIRCGLDDTRAADDVMRATAAWQRLHDDRAAAAHGRELLDLWTHLEGKGLMTPARTEAMRQVRRRLVALGAAPAQEADAPVPTRRMHQWPSE
ncbi:hypothetical protein ACH492_28140 [Streptomyces sp. NPDC019443]|uniref:hypothetical protein n=1 Tax=Streptomyces sp. NPDC019443 TaxID=3365061 RepID=UPI0037A9E584